jgi:peroxiredoxin
MKRKAWLNRILAATMVPASLSLAVCAVAAAPTKVRDFGLIDHLGDQYQLTRLAHKKAIVLISQANNCAASINNLHRYKLLRTTYQHDDVEFLMVNSSTQDNLESIRRTANIYDIDFPIMVDDSQLVAESLGIKQAGEIMVIDPKSLQLVYRGPLDKPARRGRDDDGDGAEAKEQPKPFAEAMSRLLAGEHTNAETVAVEVANKDCGYEFPVANMHAKAIPDYAKDVAPILEENCATCHVQGGIGPFAMDSYEIVRGWAPMMREVVMTKRMPPAQVDPNVNHFTNANYLSVEETQTLVHWFDAGAPRGKSKADPLKDLPVIAQGWQLGEPDAVIEVPEFAVPATGVLDYLNPTIELNFKEDKYIRAVQFIPGDTRAMHHLLAYIVSPDNTEAMDEENVRDFLEGYAPGKIDATTFPEDTAVFLPKGYNLRLSVHYTPFGKEVLDKTKIGLYFADEKPDYKFLTKSISHGGTNIVIPPNVPEHPMNMSYVWEDDVMLHALRPHMHYRGKSFRFTAIYPDGTREVLMNVPNYNFAWQPTYRFSEPKFLPAGTRVVNDAVFDNSASNPGVPDPAAVVKGGPQSWDEMFIGYYTYTVLNPGDERPVKQELTRN